MSQNFTWGVRGSAKVSPDILFENFKLVFFGKLISGQGVKSRGEDRYFCDTYLKNANMIVKFHDVTYRRSL
jgi:hypothetical protein